jgi:hypothetical protein
MPTDDRSVINLEHVLPKKPDGNWPQFSDEEVSVWVNRLANQALMRASDNADLKSTTFESKKALVPVCPDEPDCRSGQVGCGCGGGATEGATTSCNWCMANMKRGRQLRRPYRASTITVPLTTNRVWLPLVTSVATEVLRESCSALLSLAGVRRTAL